MLNPASPTHLKLTFKRRSCLFDKSTTYTWSVESVFYVRSKAGSIPRCINNKRVGIVDLTKLYSRITGVTLPVAMNKPTLFIQPYTLSPGTTYRICVLLQQNKTERILCTLIGTNSTKTKDLLFIKMDPPMNIFTLWPTDLIFNASKSFFLYMLDEAGYMGKKTITFSWSCSGNQNCNNIKSHFGINSGGTDVEVTGDLITNKASYIIIRRLWLQPASLLKIMLKVSVKYQMQVISRMVGWTITIPERYSGPEVIPHVFIRCLSNCQYYVNVRHPLRLGVGCRNCEEVTSTSVELKWSSTKPGGHIFNATQMYATIKVEPTVNLTEFRVTLTFTYFHRAEKIESVASRDFLTPGLTNFSVQTTRSHRMITTLWDDWGRTAQFSVSSRQPNQEVSTSLFQELSRSRVTLSSNNTAVPQSIHQRVTATQRNPVGQLVTEITTDRFRLIFRPYEVKSTALNVIFPLIYVLNVTTHLVLGQGTGANGFQILTTSSLDFYLPLNLAPTVNLKTVSSFGLYLSDSQDVTIPLNSDLKVTNLSDAFHKYFSNNDADITQLLFLLCQMIDSDLDISSQIKYVEFIYRHLIDPQHNLVDYSNFTVVLFLMKRLFYLLQKLIGWGHLNLFSFCDSSTYFLKIIRKILDMHNEHLDVPIYDYSKIYWQIIDILDDIKRNCDAAYKRNVHYLQAFNIGTDIFIILDIALQHCPFRLNQLSPFADSIVECCSFDSSQKRMLRLGSTHAYGYVYVETHTYSLLINDISIDPYIQMAVYGSHESSLSSRIGDLEINAPVIMIVIQQLSPLDYFLEEVYWEIFDIRLIPKPLTFDQKTFRIKLHTGLNRLGNRVVIDSDCLLLKARRRILFVANRMKVIFNASVMFGTQLFLRPSLDMIYTVSPIIVRSTRETLDIMDKGYVEMPRTYNETLRNITGDPTSLFLPQLPLEYLLAKDTKFYLLIRVKERHVVKGNDLLKLTVFCKRVTCGRWSSEDKSWTARNCRPSNMSMLTPEYINCRCDTGRIFSGGVEDCSSSMEVPWKDYAVMKTQWDGDPNMQSTYWYYVIFVWIVFLALLVWTYRRDRLDRPMGAVHVLPRLFTPYQSDQYLVCIVTGWMFGAGTLSTPLLTITDNEECGIYLLFPDQNLFQSGSEIWFLLSCPDNVQNLDKIIFSVGSAHYADDWHVSHIFMKHLNRDEELYCICDSWIPDLSNGFRFIVRPVTWTQGSAVRKFVFNVIRMFRTLHVFIGTFYNVPGSHFSKSQHALCLLFHVILNLFVCLSLAEDAKLDLQGDRNTKKNERAAGNFSTLFIFSVTVTSLLSFSVVAWFEMLDYLSLTRAKLRYPHDINYRNKVTSSASSLASGNHLNNISQKSSTVYSRGYLSSKPDRSSNVDKNAASFSKDWLPTVNLDISQNKGYPWWGGFSQSDHQSDVTSESTFASGSTPSILSERARQLTRSLLAKPRMDSRRTALKKRTMVQVENYFKLRELERTFLGSKVDIHADAESLAGTFSDFMDNLGLAEDAAFRASFRSFLPNLLQLVSNLLVLSVTLVLSVRLIYASLSLKDNSRVKALFWMTLPFSLCVVHPILILILTAMLTNRDLIGISMNAERRLRGINSQLVFHMKMASQCYVEKSRYVPKNRCYFRKNKKDRHRRYCQFFVKAAWNRLAYRYSMEQAGWLTIIAWNRQAYSYSMEQAGLISH
uniref:PLAT domain-containing protein n=1 Tax=Biomphalaria glabrata TaxID=6526 RepID=A0A2C9KTJ2_BIOGL